MDLFEISVINIESATVKIVNPFELVLKLGTTEYLLTEKRHKQLVLANLESDFSVSICCLNNVYVSTLSFEQCLQQNPLLFIATSAHDEKLTVQLSTHQITLGKCRNCSRLATEHSQTRKELQTLREILSKNTGARKDLQKHIQNSSGEYKKVIDGLKVTLEAAQEELQRTNTELNSAKREIASMNAVVQGLQSEVVSKNDALKTQVEVLTQYKIALKELKNRANNTQKIQVDEVRKEKNECELLQKTMEELQKQITELLDRRHSLENELRLAKNHSEHSHATAISRIELLEKESKTTQHTLHRTTAQLHEKTEEAKLLSIELASMRALKHEAKTAAQPCKCEDFHKAKQDLAAAHKKIVQLTVEISALNAQVSSLEVQVNAKNSTITGLESLKTELETTVESLNDSLKVQRKPTRSKRSSKTRIEAQDLLELENFRLKDKLDALSVKFTEAQETIDALQATVRHFYSEGSYVPAKTDPVDLALASFLIGKTIDIPFVREAPGIYKFGFRRVFVKLENGILSIRLGGGYMRIEEFIELYTSNEVERLLTKSRHVVQTGGDFQNVTNLKNPHFKPMYITRKKSED